MTPLHRAVPVVLVVAVACTATATPSLFANEQKPGVSPAKAANRLFTIKVLPLLKVKCFGCHGNDPDEVRGDLDIRSRKSLLTGGESGKPALVPGHPEKSPLYQAVLWNGLEMPPKANDRLTKTETGLIRDWITAGARWPDETTQNTIRTLERS
ncbi:MAG: c-type cytochrome domain-containing protein, partial [Planctomycetota bacterium]|nr:c-type cytochrome domain-containing protein [Planctomycetota bacterium]